MPVEQTVGMSSRYYGAEACAREGPGDGVERRKRLDWHWVNSGPKLPQFSFNQPTLIVNDVAGAVSSTQAYLILQWTLSKLALVQWGSTARSIAHTHPWHYRNFNIAGMVTNAGLLNYADPGSKAWSTTAQGATIQTGLDFLMTTDPSATGEANTAGRQKYTRMSLLLQRLTAIRRGSMLGTSTNRVPSICG
ncbi:hypothetical protein C8F01DRAFT_1292665 [Mycena amicta]|nr:hypothetical protein C8F01DRAFT_1292665 [Mycena amicta]